MPWNVFVLGCDELGERLLPTLQHAEEYAFHPLLPLEEAVHAERYDIERLLEDAVAELEVFPGRIDAVVGYWDFPTSALLPLIRQHFGLRGPSLEAVLKCEHKYWSRLEQSRSVPGCVPPFQVLDPFGEDPASQVRLGYPFWIKPVKGHSSQLGFRIDDADALAAVLPRIRANIGRLAEPFTQVAALAHMPDEIRAVSGHHCILEGLISAGRQCTLEGYVLGGEVHVYGVIDTIRDRRHHSVLSRYVYPSSLPEAVQQRMIDCTRRFLGHIGYDDAPFNIEFYYDPDTDQVWLLEVNSRLSRSHSAIFLLVDGAPHLQVMVDVALGLRPRMPRGRGRYAVAAKHMIRVFEDGRVRSVPSAEDIRRLEQSFPGTVVEINVRPGMQLSALLHQDEYSYELGVIFTGADDEAQLAERLRICESLLPFGIDPLERRASA